ncbi:MAG TPA: polysaccharide deacetylase family protein [Candidatus Omnitrophota bacterium]|nr:polysaccharide deacetylase family protein [Candidatus Omnitrophota bacterium]
MSKRIKLFVVIGVIAVLVVAGILFVRSRYVVPILMYHTVYSDPPYSNRLAVSTATFEKQMAFLKKNHYAVMPLPELVDCIKEKKRLPSKPIALTFDDGYKDMYTDVFPILKKYGIPGTFFIIVQEVGRPQNDRLNWDQIKEMQASGFVTIGSHTIGPEPLINFSSADDVRWQITESKRVLQEKLGCPVTMFSYPEGLFTPAIRQMVIDAGYDGAVATKPRKQYAVDDVYALRRLRISESSRNMFVFWAQTSGVYSMFKKDKRRGK